MTTILITGATGTIGSLLAGKLADAGETVRGATRAPKEAQLPKGVVPTRFDYADENSVREALVGVDRLFLLAPAGLAAQVEHETAVLRHAKEAGVTHVVLLSAMGAPEDSAHGQMEAAVAASGLGYTILKPTFFAQNFTTYVRDSVAKDSAIPYPSGDGQVAYIDAKDIAAVAAKVLASPAAHDGKSYDLTGPELLNHTQVAKILSDALGREIKYLNPSVDVYRAGLKSAGMPDEVVDMFSNLYDVVIRNGYAAQVSSAVKDITGHAANGFAAFAEEHKSSWQQEVSS